MMGVKDIAFPNLGIYLENVPKSISVFGFEIAFYGIIIFLGVVVGILVGTTILVGIVMVTINKQKKRYQKKRPGRMV